MQGVLILLSVCIYLLINRSEYWPWNLWSEKGGMLEDLTRGKRLYSKGLYIFKKLVCQ